MSDPNPVLNNATTISVSELSSALRRTLEDRFGYVRVRGEISGYRGPHSSGHAYFTLKDEGARLDAVIWKSAFLKMRVKPEEGLEVVAAGKLTTFPGKSTYQIVVDAIEPAGVGALMALLEMRRRQLASEGLFDNARKRPLPFLPATIGVVTSPTGSVIRDILHRLADRFPVRVTVWPVRVQGESAAEEIAAAIGGFGALSEASGIPRPDVLIVARGGGALEDLWSFNEEIVVRAAFASPIPLVSAVGHETDWTLLDHVADFRAPTPTAAAELCVPVRTQLVARINVAEARLTDACSRLQQRGQAEVRSLARGLPAAAAIISGPRQSLDSAFDGLNSSLQSRLGACALAVAVLARRLARYSPRVQLSRASERVRIAEARIAGFSNVRLSRARHGFKSVQADLKRAIVFVLGRRRDRFGRQADRWTGYGGLAMRTVGERSGKLAWFSGRLNLQARAELERKRRAVVSATMLFGAMNCMAVLSRGYALVRDKFGAPLTSIRDVRASQQLRVQFADGEIAAKVAGAQALKGRKLTPTNAEQRMLL